MSSDYVYFLGFPINPLRVLLSHDQISKVTNGLIVTTCPENCIIKGQGTCQRIGCSSNIADLIEQQKELCKQPFLAVLSCVSLQMEDQHTNLRFYGNTLDQVRWKLGQHNFSNIKPADPMQAEFAEVTRDLSHMTTSLGHLIMRSRSLKIILREIHRIVASDAKAYKIIEWTENLQLEIEMNEIEIEDLYKQAEIMLTVVS